MLSGYRRLLVTNFRGDALEIGFAIQNSAHGGVQTEGVERLDQPTVGTAAPGEVHVGFAIEQHDDRNVL